MDGRIQIFPAQFWKSAYLSSGQDCQRVLQDADADVAILPKNKSHFRKLLADMKWETVYEDDQATVMIPQPPIASAPIKNPRGAERGELCRGIPRACKKIPDSCLGDKYLLILTPNRPISYRAQQFPVKIAGPYIHRPDRWSMGPAQLADSPSKSRCWIKLNRSSLGFKGLSLTIIFHGIATSPVQACC